jgi:hypothetical protein
MYINVIHNKTIQQKNPPTTLVLKYIFIFSYCVTSIILSHIYSIHYSKYIYIYVFLGDLVCLCSHQKYYNISQIQDKNNNVV